MALESFGKDTAKMIDHATILCHDMLRDTLFTENIAEEFKAGQKGIWSVEPGEFDDGSKCVVIKLGVG